VKPRDFLIVFAIIVPFAGFILYTGAVRSAVGTALELCGKVLIPSMLPCMVMTNLLLESGGMTLLGRPFEKMMRPLFRLPGECAPVLMMGLTAGYPIGARGAILLYQKGILTREECERLLAFCNNSGPTFIFGTLGLTVFASSRVGLLLFIAHSAASLTVGLLFRFYRPGDPKGKTEKKPENRIVLTAETFTDSISGAADSLIHMTAYVTFFSATIAALRESGFLYKLSVILSGIAGQPTAYIEALLTGILEMTGGIFRIMPQEGNIEASVTMAAFLLGWAGLSVHFQVLSFLGESGLSTWPYFAGKLLHGVISAVYARLLTGWIAVETSGTGLSGIAFGVSGQRLFWLSLAAGAVMYLFLGLYTALRQKRF